MTTRWRDVKRLKCHYVDRQVWLSLCGRWVADMPIECITRIPRKVTCALCRRCIRKAKRDASKERSILP